jgi:hypothetical protein
MAYEGKWVCDDCGDESDDEFMACSCEDTCTEHIRTIDSLRTQVKRLQALIDTPEECGWPVPTVEEVGDRSMVVWDIMGDGDPLKLDPQEAKALGAALLRAGRNLQ